MITVNFLIYSFKKSDYVKNDNSVTATTELFSLFLKLQNEEVWS